MNIREVLLKAYEKLKKENIDTYQLDAQLLLSKVLVKDRLFILTNPNYNINEDILEKYTELINLRKNKMPIKYILEKSEFMGIDFYIKKGVLIPRPDTEILVEEVLSDIKTNNFKNICDVCCGSGAIGLSISKILEDVKVNCYDISNIACSVTEKNINNLSLKDRCKVYKSDLLKKCIEEDLKFDVIVSNPPYIKEKVIETLMEDVKNYEPYEALSGGEDGLDFYRKITNQSLEVLKKDGLLAFEIGYDQKYDVENILRDYGFHEITTIKDLAGKDRVVKGFK